MFNLTLWRGNGRTKRQQEIKARIVKNEEVVLEALAKRAKGSKTCPFYLGAQCVADACEFFQQYVSIDDETGKKTEYFRCLFTQIPKLQIELIQNIRENNKLLRELLTRKE